MRSFQILVSMVLLGLSMSARGFLMVSPSVHLLVPSNAALQPITMAMNGHPNSVLTSFEQRVDLLALTSLHGKRSVAPAIIRLPRSWRGTSLAAALDDIIDVDAVVTPERVEVNACPNQGGGCTGCATRKCSVGLSTGSPAGLCSIKQGTDEQLLEISKKLERLQALIVRANCKKEKDAILQSFDLIQSLSVNDLVE